MEFIHLLYILVTGFAILTMGFVVSKYVKKQGLLHPTVVDLTNQVFLLLRIVMMKASNERKEQIDDIFSAIQSVFNYVYMTSNDLPPAEKKQLAKQQILERLSQFHIALDDDDMILIEMITDTFVALIFKNELENSL